MHTHLTVPGRLSLEDVAGNAFVVATVCFTGHAMFSVGPVERGGGGREGEFNLKIIKQWKQVRTCDGLWSRVWPVAYYAGAGGRPRVGAFAMNRTHSDWRTGALCVNVMTSGFINNYQIPAGRYTSTHTHSPISSRTWSDMASWNRTVMSQCTSVVQGFLPAGVHKFGSFISIALVTWQWGWICFIAYFYKFGHVLQFQSILASKLNTK